MNPEEDPCPIVDALSTVAGRWKGSIIWHLRDGPKRFGALRNLVVGVSPKVLTQQLRELERDGLVDREQFAEIPPRVEYTLTRLGHSVVPVLDAVTQWWRKHGKAVVQARRKNPGDDPA